MYPAPGAVKVIEATVVGVRLAVAAAPLPPPPVNPTVGGAVYPVPAPVMATEVTECAAPAVALNALAVVGKLAELV